MKILISFLVINSILFNVNAQVKIGAPGDPDINAVLELAGSSKGLLLPRIALTGTSSPAPLSAFVAGMVVYNTANVADVSPGYFYSDGIKWNRLPNSSETWAINGNAATNPANQFLGTIDATDFSIRTNNLERIRINSSGFFDIGTNSLSDNVRIRIGGTTGGAFAATVGINGTINSTQDNQRLYSLLNNPTFGTSFEAESVRGTSTEMRYAGRATGYVIADNANVSTNGTNNYPLVTGMLGSVTRLSTGTADGGFYGGYFSAEGTSAGTVNSMFGIYGKAQLFGNNAISVGSFGAQDNIVTISNANATVSGVFGIRNIIGIIGGATSSSVIGLQTHISASNNSTFSTAYATVTNISAFGGGMIANAYGHLLSPIPSSTNITNYTGIHIGDIGLTSGIRRAFVYAATGTNTPVVINYDGSVQIGTYTTVPNAKLSIVDGHLQSGQTTKPTISTWPNIGTGGTATLNDATDIAGIIDLDLGSGAWSSGPQATITFNKVYANSPIVIITPANSEAAAGVELQRPHVTTNATSFTISFGAAATNGNMMRFNYHVIETVNN